MREPQAALSLRHARQVLPRGILRRDLGGVGQEGLVLDDHRDLVGRESAAGGAEGGQCGLLRVLQQVGARFAGVDVETRHAQGVVVEPHEAGALVVGVEVGLRARAGIHRCARDGVRRSAAGEAERHVGRRAVSHVGNALLADALLVDAGLARRGDPLVRRAVADPHRVAAMQMEHRAVLRVLAGSRAIGAGAGAHHGGVDRQEEVAASVARAQVVDEPDAHRSAPLRDDHRPEVRGRGVRVDLGAVVEDRSAARIRQRDVRAGGGVGCSFELDVAAEGGRIGEVGVELLAELDDRELVVVTACEGRLVRHRRDEIGERVDELPQPERTVRPVGVCAPVVGDGRRHRHRGRREQRQRHLRGRTGCGGALRRRDVPVED